MQKGSKNELLGITFYTYPPTTRSIDWGAEVHWPQPHLCIG